MGRRRRFLVPALLALAVAVVLATTTFNRAPAEVATPASAPGGVLVNARSRIAVVSWDGPRGQYLVELATDPAFTGATGLAAEGNLAVVDGLEPQTAYYVRVSAVTAAGAGAASATVGFRTMAEVLPFTAPRVRLGSASSTTVTATWPPASDDAFYQVELATDPGFAGARSSMVNEPSATFDALTRTRTYHVRVRVVGAAGAALSEWSPAASGKPLQTAPLVVGTYNILKSRRNAWEQRKPALVRTILGEDPDVVGLQEATPVTTGTGRRQYDDLRVALGADWALVDGNRASTGETRTIYNTRRLELVSAGYDLIEGSRRFRGIPRYVTWAVFRQRSTDKRFLFVNTHFVPRTSRASDPHRVSAARQLVATVERVNTADLPVVVVGDFNTGMNRTSSNRVYRTLLAGGFRDPLATPRGKLGHAERTIRENVKTVNGYRRVADRDSFAPLVDHIFVSPMRVREWEVVARLDRSGRFIGTIPSDHNMVRATVELP